MKKIDLEENQSYIVTMASLTESKRYTIPDFHKIINSGYNYTIDEQAVEIINMLAQKVGAPSYQRTPNFTKNDKMGRHKSNLLHKRKPKRNQEICDEDWEAIRNFQATEIQEAEGINKLINNLRTEINKISLQTYDTQFKIICDILKELTESNAFKEEDKIKVGSLIFEVACTNKFYSELYSKLIKELNDLFEWLPSIFKSSIIVNFKKFLEFEVADGNKDYEKFCKINKDNENRKSVSTFYINLYKKEIITISEIIEYLQSYKNLLTEKLNSDESQVVEQLAENISILVLGILDEEENEYVEEIKEYITHLSQTKPSQHTGLTNKTVFIFMDLCDKF